MKFNFREEWLVAVDKKNSILCAGIDPADCIMGRTDKGAGLPAETNKRDWIFKYMAAVGPYVAAFKPNVRYFGGGNENTILNEIGAWARELGAVFIQDSKEADIGETNDAGIFRAALRGAHAVTLAPFAGNLEEAARQGKDRNIGIITMGLMSSPDYATVKNMWVAVPNDVENYDPADIKEIDGVPHTRFYMKQAREANRLGLAGVVLGAPSSSNHISSDEVERVSRYLGKAALLLVPGIGAQGGEVTALLKNFDATRMIANVGRALMFPDPRKAYATAEDRAAAAKHYMNMLNELRKTAA
jgi:orotidine-5'-phosphate decarboxylase